MDLYYSKESKSQLSRYENVGYLSDPHKTRSQTGYVFTYGGTTISRRLVKQTMVAAYSNHSEIIVIHEASCKSVWLRSMIQYIQETYGLPSVKGNAIKLHEDNIACIAQIKGGSIKGDKTKHIFIKFFYTHEL